MNIKNGVMAGWEHVWSGGLVGSLQVPAASEFLEFDVLHVFDIGTGSFGEQFFEI